MTFSLLYKLITNVYNVYVSRDGTLCRHACAIVVLVRNNSRVDGVDERAGDGIQQDCTTI